ncbi:MAG: hypothetical protein LBQ15_06760 [Clostridium sp.]|jgi:hypothetical protein|nr:hypothetical protein [Clostridium sp.]
MKKLLIKTAVFVLVFLASLVIVGKITNRGHDNMTMELASATLPVVTMESGAFSMESGESSMESGEPVESISYNQLHGYRKPMEVAFQRRNITQLGSSRDLYFTVDTYGRSVSGISAELRSLDGSRLIESSPVTDVEEEGTTLRARLELKDLMEADKEYALVILLTMEEGDSMEGGDSMDEGLSVGKGEVVRYYTKVVWSENTHAVEKLRFVKDFHEKLYDKEAARELTKYLESNAQGDNSTFHKVNIHSSFHMITWGDLDVREETEPVIQLTELAGQTACALVSYLVSLSGDGGVSYYQTEEYYRIRYTAERTYLLDYERTMTQIPDMEEDMYANDKILLGIVGRDIPFLESEDGNIVLFEAANRLCGYNVNTNKLTVLFSFFDTDNMDARALYFCHDFKILDVDEGGNVRFAVYGYLNRGRHEGEVGIQIYYFDSGLNTLNEEIYLPYGGSYEVLAAQMEQLLYLNRENILYLFLENSVFRVDLNEKVSQKIVTVTQDDSLQVSENHHILVWQEGEDLYRSAKLMVKNLHTGEEHAILAQSGEAIRLLGFMEEDVIYGVARVADVVRDHAGQVFFPMYQIGIRNSEGELLKTYRRDGEALYVTDCTVADNQITLRQVRRLEDGTYQEASDNQITYNMELAKGKNKLVEVDTDRYGRYLEIQVRHPIDAKALKVLTPKEVVFEGERELELALGEEAQGYYVYGAYGVAGIFHSPAAAVRLAASVSGVVSDRYGACIWRQGNRAARNQIMAIRESGVPEGGTSLAVCLDTILKLEGMTQNAQLLLSQGLSVTEILQGSIEGIQVLDLTGCGLEELLFYVNRDLPVLAALEDGEAVLVTGFNEFNVVIFEPSTGRLYQKGLKDSAEWFEENGNSFVAYVRKEG